jgi:diguanylate cyclase (GGDEF)-like protein
MLKQGRFFLVMSTILILIGLSFSYINDSTIKKVYADQGQITFSESLGNARAQLLGQWQVFPNTLADDITPTTPYQWVDGEHLWTAIDGQSPQGVATYRLTLNGLMPSRIYAITTQDEAGAYRLRVNGFYVMGNGVVSNQADTYLPEVKTVVGYFTSDASGKAELSMEIANFTRKSGGMWHALEVGYPDVITRHYTTVVGFEVLTFAVMISIGLLFLLFSSIRKEITAFYGSLFALIMALRVVSTGTHIISQTVPFFPLLTVLKLEYWSGYILIPVFAMILESLEYLKPNPVRQRIIFGYAGVVTLFILLANDVWLEWSYPVNQGMIAVFALYATYLLIQGLRKRDESAGYLLVGSLALMVGTYAELNLNNVSYALFFASFAFVLSVAASVVIRFGGLKAAKETLEKDVMTDYLTGVGNRAYVYKVLNQLTVGESDMMHYLIFVDLDDFKTINDAYGHEIGDEVLRQTAQRLKVAVRDHDVVVRFAGDEFIIIVQLHPQYPIDSVIERLHHQFLEPVAVGDLSIPLRLSIGSVRIGPSDQDPDAIISQADQRMYEEKENHKKERMR